MFIFQRRSRDITRLICDELKIVLRRRRAKSKFKKIAASGAPIVLDLGAGGPGRRGSWGVDLSPNADIIHDLTEGLPLPDCSVQELYSDHFFEHLYLSDVVDLFEECYRVLVPGGVLRFTVPHIDPFVEAYLAGDLEFLKAKIADVPSDNAHLYGTPFDRLSWLLHRSGEHRSLFDRESILHKVRLAGFSRVETGSFDPAKDRNPRFSSVYVEAIK